MFVFRVKVFVLITRECNSMELCGVWAEREGAKLRVHAAQTLMNSWCETETEADMTGTCRTNSDSDLSLFLVPSSAASCIRGSNDKGVLRREAAVRMKHALQSQYELEKSRAEKVRIKQ